MQKRKCDFCSDSVVRWRYPVEDYLVRDDLGSKALLIRQELGGWAACQECYRLIESGDWNGLVRHSARKLMTADMTAQELEFLLRLYIEYFAHRSGPPIAVEG